MSNLLDKASIILTPTAYNNGKALCVKPSDGSGDFQFSRNSAATRVNAQGLVENVQILSSNLVQNPSFSEEGVQEVSNGSFSQEGVDLVTNGDFATDSDWGLQTGWSISGGSLNAVNTNGIAFQSSLGLVIGKTYKVSLNTSNYVSGSARLKLGGSAYQNISTTDSFQEFYFIPTSNTDNIIFSYLSTFTGSIDNVSVREVGQDWSLGTGWSIGEDKAVATNSASGQKLRQAGQLTASKTYKLVYEITELTLGGFLPIVGAVQGTAVYSIGTYTEYITTTNDDFYIRTLGTTSGSITNISVKEVGQNWTLGTGWSIGEDKAISDTTASNLTPSTTLISGEKYKFTLDVAKISAGSFTFLLRFNGTNTTFATINTEGSFTFYATADATGFRLQNLSGGTTDFSVTNITAVQITDDTNLPRINYENFSYQDALGSEEVVNGTFDNGSANWTLGSSWSVSNGLAYTDGSAQNFISQNIGLVTGKTYNLSFDISNRVGTDGCIVIFGGTTFSGNAFANGTQTFQATANGGIELRIYGFNGNTYNLDNVSVKEYLGQEIVPNSGCGSWLFEPQSTNLIEYSENFSGNWLVDDVTISSDLTISPSGESYSPIMVVNTVASRHNIKRTKAGVNTATLSIFAKARELSYIQIASANSTTQFANFDLSNGTIGSVGSSFSDAKIEDYGNGWYRCSAVSDNQYNQAIFSLVTSATSPWLQSWTSANNTDGLYIWGAMLDENSFITSYIPTSGSTVTRNQDVCNNGGSLATINSTEGTLYFEGAALSNDGTTRIISLSDGTTANRVNLFFDTTNTLRAFITGVPSIATAAVITDNNKVALKFKSGDISVWLNGTEVATSTSAISLSGLSNLSFNQVGSSNFFGKTKALVVWKEALSDQELTELTTI